MHLCTIVPERFDQSTLITFFTKITFNFTLYKFYSQYIQYEEIGLFNIGFFVLSFYLLRNLKLF